MPDSQGSAPKPFYTKRQAFPMAPDLNSLPPSRSTSQSNRNTPHSHPLALPLVQSNPASTSTPSTSNASPDASRNPPFPHNNSPMMSHGSSSAQSPSSYSPRHRSSPRVERRRSSLLVGDWSLNESMPTTPGTADPYHHRTPSLGELHQELENEQEAQVNRLLALIRQQQAQLAQYQAMQTASQGQTSGEPTSASTNSETPSLVPASSAPVTHLSTSAGAENPAMPRRMSSQRSHAQAQQSSRLRSSSQRSTSTTPANPRPDTVVPSMQPPPTTQGGITAGINRNYRAEISPSARRRRSSSRQSSHQTSPALRPTSYHSTASNSWPGDPASGGDATVSGGGRDEVSLMQAEAAMVQRENQMLKSRIRELERMVRDMAVGEEGRQSIPGVSGTGGRDDALGDAERGRRAA